MEQFFLYWKSRCVMELKNKNVSQTQQYLCFNVLAIRYGKSRGHLARMRKMRDTSNKLGVRPTGTILLARTRRRWEDIIKARVRVL